MLNAATLFAVRLFLLATGMLCLCSVSLTAQEDAQSAWTKFPPGVEESQYAPIAPGEGSFQEARVHPPSWFVNLDVDTVQVLLYDRSLAGQQVRVRGAGVELLSTQEFQNPRYLLLEVRLTDAAELGSVDFVLSDGRSYTWPLLAAQQPSSLDASDLVYLIMPDRFANGDPSNDSYPDLKQQGVDRSKFLFRHGGDLDGIADRLPYLDSLGVTTLWLNPVLENDQPYESYHGYAVTDHYAVDARLGGNTAYLELVQAAHAQGMKVLMDLVPNHVGDQHHLYADMPARSWWHLPDTFTRSNFRIPSVVDPHAAKGDQQQMLNGWFDHHMADFNQDDPVVRRYLTQLAIWWIAYSGHDGYRVDTYPYSDPEFMAEWSAELKRTFPTLSFFGEVWVDGLPHQASFVPGPLAQSTTQAPVPVGGNLAVTDFQLYGALLEALTRRSGWVEGVCKLWLTLSQDYLYEDPNALITFVDNHDLTRIASVVQGDQERLRSALTLLLTLRGTPMLYYGTELGMEGSGGGFGEGGRKDFPGGFAGDTIDVRSGRGLSDEQSALLEHVRRLGTYRRSNPALATGPMVHFVCGEDSYAYVRGERGADQRWLVVFNAAPEACSLRTERFAAELEGFALSTAKDVLAEQVVDLSQTVRLEAGQTRLFALSRNL